MKRIMRGDLYYADLSPVVGSEQGGTRPVIVVQNNTGNEFSPTVIVAVLTTRTKRPMPTHIDLCTGEGNLTKDSTVMLEQLKTIDKTRLQRFIGSVTTQKMNEINQAMLVSLGLSLTTNIG